MPRYYLSGAIHISILFSLIVLSLRVISMVLSGVSSEFAFFEPGGIVANVYNSLADIGETVILIACVVAIIRRGVFKPARYNVPEQYGKDRSPEALAYMAMLGVIVLCDILFQGSHLGGCRLKPRPRQRSYSPGTGAYWIAGSLLSHIILIGYSGNSSVELLLF